MIQHYKPHFLNKIKPERRSEPIAQTMVLENARLAVEGGLEAAASQAYQGKGGINKALEDAYAQLITEAGVKIDHYFDSLLTSYPQAIQEEAKAIYYEGKNVKKVKDLLKYENALGQINTFSLNGKLMYEVLIDEELAKTSLNTKLTMIHEIIHWLQKKQWLEIVGEEEYKKQMGIAKTMYIELSVIPAEQVLYHAIPESLLRADIKKIDCEIRNKLINCIVTTKDRSIERSLDFINPLYNESDGLSPAGFREMKQQVTQSPPVTRWITDMYGEGKRPIKGRDLPYQQRVALQGKTPEEQIRLRETWTEQATASKPTSPKTR